jgi:spore coat polysaccharide biosynthesis protein SpsF
MKPETDYLGEMTETFPDGLDIEIMKYAALKESWEEAVMASEREHVTQYIRKHPEKYNLQDLECPIKGIGNKRWTLDEDADYEMICHVYEYFIGRGKEDFVTEDILEYLNRHPEIENLNAGIGRNEGLRKSIAEDQVVIVER